MRILLTGAAGFVGSHVLRHLLTTTDAKIVCPVSFRHQGLPARISSAVCDHEWRDRVEIVHWDMRAPADPLTLCAFDGCDVIMNVASESHVDRSIEDPVGFTTNNVALMLNVLEVARKIKPRLFLQMSTDEVYGPAYGMHRHKEWEAVVPSNPYSASKAAQEAIATAYWRTYGVPVIITNTMNIIGEMQSPEKFVPMVIRSLRDRQHITVHTSPEGVPGSRFYLHARNLADAWLFLVQRTEEVPDVISMYSWGASRPNRFHIVGEREVDNVTMVHQVAAAMGIEQDEADQLIFPVSFHASRPGHDLRYALDGTRLAASGWKPPVPLEESLERSVKWTLEHPEWLDV
jgi:dTDP-glucose 4,6-dehydratase